MAPAASSSASRSTVMYTESANSEASPVNEPPLRRVPIPVREPKAARRVAPPIDFTGQDSVPPTQGTLALALPWEAPPAALTTSRTASHGRTSADDGHRRKGRTIPGLTPVTVLPEPRDWASTFVQAAMEVATGLRPPGQLIRWTTPEIQEALARRGALVARAVRRSGVPLVKPKVRALLICTPAPRVCEVAAVVADSEKVRAVAFRMQAFQGRWRVTVLDIG